MGAVAVVTAGMVDFDDVIDKLAVFAPRPAPSIDLGEFILFCSLQPVTLHVMDPTFWDARPRSISSPQRKALGIGRFSRAEESAFEFDYQDETAGQTVVEYFANLAARHGPTIIDDYRGHITQVSHRNLPEPRCYNVGAVITTANIRPDDLMRYTSMIPLPRKDAGSIWGTQQIGGGDTMITVEVASPQRLEWAGSAVAEWQAYLAPRQLGSVVFCDYWVFGMVTNRVIAQVAQSVKMQYPEATVVLYNFRSRRFIDTWSIPDWDQIIRNHEAGR